MKGVGQMCRETELVALDELDDRGMVNEWEGWRRGRREFTVKCTMLYQRSTFTVTL